MKHSKQYCINLLEELLSLSFSFWGQDTIFPIFLLACAYTKITDFCKIYIILYRFYNAVKSILAIAMIDFL